MGRMATTSVPLVVLRGDVMVTHGPDGPDFTRICGLHRWASLPSVYQSDLPRCPHCELETDAGRNRFEAIQLQLMPDGARA